ncbi:hypothetical protein H4R20_002621 [Coemansia guatemalensis]|uniref:Secreted protein n=1 Tax=Coemansia guatemalensis TaxID=2761395 RepID=A0A9W8I3G9_9FUNG|nr:hypothetical protein H4R20_002621 [Coemansia guatemalensis]
MKFATFALFAAAATIATVSAADTKPWKITNLSSGERTNLCGRQIQTCQNNCGGPKEAPMAFCNSTTMAWGCGCSEKTPDFETWNWPVPAADCAGSNEACQANCNAGSSSDRNDCFASCSATHKCNTEDAPVSYTTTKDVDSTPQYVGPAVSYKGDKLDDLNDGNDRENVESSSEDSESGKDADASDSEEDTSSTGNIFKPAALAVVAAISAGFAL